MTATLATAPAVGRPLTHLHTTADLEPDMPSVISHHTISLDGFLAGPDDAMPWVGE